MHQQPFAGIGLAKQILERRPQIACEREDCKLDATFLLCHVAPHSLSA
jgi:hypothetical protein